MASSLACRSLSLFVFLLILDGTAIFFFTRGFLLTRTELSELSTCSDIAQCPSSCFEHFRPNLNSKHVLRMASSAASVGGDSNLKSRMEDGEMEKTRDEDNHKKCWTRPAIKKAVILIIDALRFDFVAHSRNFPGEPKPWMDRLHVLQHNVEENNRTAGIFKFIADPPTTTLQRLKGLTTGGLPTFIDIGHSFGAPAIAEDNLILQLARTGKKVIMMGDDTWMQLFPTQFAEAYPFPSFNVKDLHTVDDGVIRELFPALQRDDWDVLIAHFLGVDHVGHIFGVESPLMPQKLDQYNNVIEDVVQQLGNMSKPGGLFEDTLLIVMGDHGQTLNGDHGGGTPEEVETALFAMGTHDLPSSLLPNAFPSSCDLEDPVSGCISTFSQLDFSATLAALLGVPFPFGSVGHVNAELYTLVSGNRASMHESSHEKEGLLSSLELMNQYKEVLCVNSWQVRRYFEVYSKSAITGFPPQDLQRLDDLYTKAQMVPDALKALEDRWISAEGGQAREEMILGFISAAREQIDAYGEYLSAAASLARSQWTQFGIAWMIVGFSLLIACIAIRGLALYNLYHSTSTSVEKLFPSRVMLLATLSLVGLTSFTIILQPMLQDISGDLMFGFAKESLGVVFLVVMVTAFWRVYYHKASQGMSVKETIRKSDDVQDIHRKEELGSAGALRVMDVRIVATSLLVMLHLFSLFSNSYIVAEGLVIYFLIASSGLLYLRSAVQAQSKLLQAICFLALIWIMPKIHTHAIFKGVVSGGSIGVDQEAMSGFLRQIILTCTTILVPLGILSWLPHLKSKKSLVWRLVSIGVTASNCMIGLHWLVADLSSYEILSVSDILIQFARLQVPRLVYAISVSLIFMAGIGSKFSSRGMDENSGNYRIFVDMESTSLLAGAGGTVVLLLGRKGPLLALLIVLEVWIFLNLQTILSSSIRAQIGENDNPEPGDERTKSCFRATVDWSLISAQLFFCTGHSCAFDGLHYSAAFIGFDDFGFFQQGVLLATETFGASHFFPVIGIPLLALGVVCSHRGQENKQRPIILEMSKGYLWFGLLKALVTSVTTASVGIQRRHLMVWGIFAPKYVFDAVGFLLVDVFIIISALVYFSFQGRVPQKSLESTNSASK
ncbi:unnamed protein product [Calypogeia fissa]